MVEIISVRFRGGAKSYFFDPNGLTIAPNTHVIVETAQGLAYAKCVEGNHSVEDNAVIQPLRQVVRIATENDRKIDEYNRKREKEAFVICEQKIAAHGLEMKLVSVECGFEGSKIIFFFTAEGRVDFREVVKDLASVFRARIELRQIGVRDEAKMIGGLGICGRPLCCGQFLVEFIPVSIKMAKTQNLSLNPTKISGTCGRLMCCLKYEQNAYEDAARRMPKNDSFVDTPDGIGNVTAVDLLREEVQVRLDSAPESPKKFKNCEIRVLRNGKGSRDGIEIPKDRPARFTPPEQEVAYSRQRSAFAMNPIAVASVIAPDEDEGRRSENSRRRRGGRRAAENKGAENKPRENLVKVEKVAKNDAPRAQKNTGAAAKAEKAEKNTNVAEKLTVRSTSNTTAEKKAAADRAARVQNAPEKSGEHKKPHYRHRRHRPRGKGGSGQGE